ncbi:ribose-5-phosphate isomerase [Sphingopyxis sp. H038]|uniref:ribose-5-phosphate isomerase RpiA n=1 Tax=unclassified Sphingopyxis TaxID=2614943 RepID=UPI0007310631|nr:MULTISPECIES: ribose-5-phosphate isomerase RpiA [unclassified Sphingopyxis]KTE02544.1 ribose-5-phosphate isomerase [Sphingopyxis sp. H012]KTE11105.1 ribose-5-phosphate isomerase [Sphingopyxis sp. H053]KTE12296.1 ribose-5-phosphate isomerase [Sphingopyxis sp. H093]KTE30588.1 ribose-5-phosphate isomerase [Sphingopyxis sp. H080]KTE35593.1 ribose-5-phosphate isomerase [Sphingopyxis sp. H038]
MTNFDAEKALAAVKAVDEVRDGMLVGLGTGGTAACAVKNLSERISHGLRITAVATSQATEALARRLAVPLIPFQQLSAVDLTIDGADEIDDRFQAIKGGGGALLREKVIAAASTRVIIIVDSSKRVAQLGKFPLPVEVVPFATEFVRKRLTKLGARVTLRAAGATPFLTDQGNHILDASLDIIARPSEIAAVVAAIPGVVEHGLFLDEIDTIMIARGDMVEVRHR